LPELLHCALHLLIRRTAAVARLAVAHESLPQNRSRLRALSLF
jgi:hypothetical protein